MLLCHELGGLLNNTQGTVTKRSVWGQVYEPVWFLQELQIVNKYEFITMLTALNSVGWIQKSGTKMGRLHC